jgi:hypothetical protein
MKKRRVLEASKPARNAGLRKRGTAVHGSRLGDVVGDLEALHAETLSEMRTLSLRLNFLSRVSIMVAGAIADAHARESSRMLCQLLAVEHPGPKRRARKGGAKRK